LANGIYISATPASGTLDHTITFTFLTSCLYGLTIANDGSGASSATTQGHVFNGNFIDGCTGAGIRMYSPASAAQANQLNVFNICAMDGALAGGYGVMFDTGTFEGPNVFNFYGGFFGQFASGKAFQLANGATANGEILRANVFGNTYGDFLFNVTNGNTMETLPKVAGLSATANTTINTRSSFNGGVALTSNTFLINLPSFSYTSGVIKLWYVYSPFTSASSGGNPITVQVIGAAGGPVLVCTGAQPTGNASEIQIAIVSFATLTTTAVLQVTVGI
jgi:hypothetical protein